MFKKFELSLLFLSKLFMFCLCAAVFFLIYGQKYAFLLIPTRTSIVTLGVFVIVYMAMTVIYGGFDIGKRKSKPIINSLVLSVFFTDVVAHFFIRHKMRYKITQMVIIISHLFRLPLATKARNRRLYNF